MFDKIERKLVGKKKFNKKRKANIDKLNKSKSFKAAVYKSVHDNRDDIDGPKHLARRMRVMKRNVAKDSRSKVKEGLDNIFKE